MMMEQVLVCLLFLSLRFNGHFPGDPGQPGFIEAKDNGGGSDNSIQEL